MNPRSLENLKPGSASKGGKVAKNLSLLPSTVEAAESIGRHGHKPSCSDGIDRLFAALPLIFDVLEAIALLPDAPQDLQQSAKKLLKDLRG